MARKRLMAVLAGVTMSLGVAASPAMALELGPAEVGSEGVTVASAETGSVRLAPSDDGADLEVTSPGGEDLVTEDAPTEGAPVDTAPVTSALDGADDPTGVTPVDGPGTETPSDGTGDGAGSDDTPAARNDVKASSDGRPRVATTNAPTNGATRTSTGQVAPQYRQQLAGGGTAAQLADTQQDPGELAPMVAPARPSEQAQSAPVELAAGLQTPRSPLDGPAGAGLRTLATMLTATAAAAWWLAREHRLV